MDAKQQYRDAFRLAVSDWRHAQRELDEQYDIDPPIPF